jgi:hypothetical protein
LRGDEAIFFIVIPAKAGIQNLAQRVVAGFRLSPE